jgi:hypothetical protein
MDKPRFQRTDYSVVVKQRAAGPKPWRWKIYRAGTVDAVKVSDVYFKSMVVAARHGKAALAHLLERLMS